MKTKFKGILTLFLAFVVQISFAQERTISGTVSDASGVLPGVSILIKGTNKGISSDFDGKFKIKAKTGDILVFSYVGFKSIEKKVGLSNTLNITMTEDSSVLDEIVVTALGGKKAKRSLGYGTQKVSGEQITEARAENALSSLSGKVAGVTINTNSGNLGGSARIVLRGVGSITQSNTPLIVVDGIPLDNSNFNTRSTQQGGGGRDFGDAGFDVNPDDIESMNVLKGGAAAALYGSRAVNGVILITTKSGKEGKSSITINSGFSFSDVAVSPKIQRLYGGGSGDPATIGQSTFATQNINGTTYKLVDYATDESWGPRFDPNQKVLHWDSFDPEFASDYLKPRAWVAPKTSLDDFYETGISLNNSVIFTKGSEKSTMRLSVSNTKTTGIVPNSEINKTTVGFKGSSKISDNLDINASVNFSLTKGTNRPEIGYAGGSVIQKFYQFGQTQLDYNRLKNYQLIDGTQRTWNRVAWDNPSIRYSDNPYWIVNKYLSDDTRTRWYGTIGGKYKFSNEFYATGKIYADTYSFLVNQTVAKGSSDQSSAQKDNRTFIELNYEALIHFDKNFFNEKLTLSSFFGGNTRTANRTRLSATTNGGLVVDDIYNLSNSVDPATTTNFNSEIRLNSLLGSVSLGYDNFIFLNLTGRNDWTSTLPTNNNSYFYPSVNASLVFSELIESDWLNYGKFRGGWAKVGNDTDPYRLINTFDVRQPFQNSSRFSQPGSKLNPNLKPENKDTWEVGLEMGFFRNRLTFDLTYYNEVTSDLITPVQIDPSTGFTSKFTNGGKLKNTGIEALVNITPVKTEDFKWDVTWNFSKNNNKLIELTEGVSALVLGSFPFQGVTLNAVVGKPYGIIRGTNFVFDDNGNKVLEKGRYLRTKNQEDLGSILPDYNMGLRNNFNYKGFNLSFLIDHQKGGVYRSLTNVWGNYSGILEQTAINNIREDGVIQPGVNGTVTYDPNDNSKYTVSNTSPNTTVISAQQQGQDYFIRSAAASVFKADYFKLREITFGYTVPKKWLGNNITGLRISTFARNVFTWGLDNENFDPEVATSGSGNIQGSEGGSLPSTKTFGVNVQLKF
ncbi:SusC/RagA family TonB-linked outer membrane protein [Polaribacter cellanae]|uniref:SusC/RagA family TonB-linked outer membrane protein n=1 Tax=Polaribacter cellanae TaxID=2818493 RepID=A0A975CSF5_9FLAO|nr:SusC/RagA family TonB-linked outer membrane protein [Polaribacter cellanae]QTE23975.1 SusC/RagA family TonB-linked outer membrane protein [Polaribacter cellanae]